MGGSGFQALGVETFEDESLHVDLVDRCVRGEAVSDEAPGVRHDLAGFDARDAVVFDGGGGPDGDRGLDEVGRGDNINAGAADEFDGARVDDAHHGQAAAGRVFHGDPCAAFGEARDPLAQVLPSEIEIDGHGHVAELACVDMVNEEARVAVRGDAEHHAAGEVPLAGEELRENRVGAAEVVDEPGVDALVAHVLLDSGEVHARLLGCATKHAAGGRR